MSFHTFDSCSDNLTFALEYNHYYRSTLFYKRAKHCFEFVWRGGVGEAHYVGFSNTNNARTFAAYYHWSGLCRVSNSGFTDTSLGFKVPKGKWGMICIDTSASKFTIISGTSSKSIQYAGLEDKQTWFAYLDDGSGTGYFDNVEVNMGNKTFQNNLPAGYLPWNEGLSCFKPNKRRCSLCIRFSSHCICISPYLSLILFAS